MRKSVLAVLLAATSVAAVLATPADAKERHHAVPRAQFNQLQAPAVMGPENDPTGVYRDGRLIGRDPDPAIRSQILGSYGHVGAP
jgi:hypothetical protein